MSSHSRNNSTHKTTRHSRRKHKASFAIKDIILDPGDEDLYGDGDFDSYEDTKIEMRNAGHNLTSVVMNPRETFMEGIFDEFAAEQRLPLETSTAATSTASSLSMSSTSSIHSHTSASNHSSSHSTISIASNYSSTSMFSSSMLFTTKAEDEQLSFAMNRIKEAYMEYLRVHEAYALSSNRDQGAITSASGSTIVQNISAGGGVMKLGNTTITHEELLMCFREVPEVFFRPEFSLQNAEMFNLAMGTKLSSASHNSHSEHSKESNISPKNGRMSSFSSFHQQEQLTKYLDIIELALLNNIWIRSPSFFRVLDDIRSLQTLVSAGHACVLSLRQKYQALSERTSMTVLRIPKLYVRQRNENLLHEKLACMQRVMFGQSMIVSMVEMEDYLGALEIIREMRQIYHDELEGLTSMKAIGSQLEKYDNYISDVMCNKFVSLAIQFEDDVNSIVPSASSHQSINGSAATTGFFKESSSELKASRMDPTTIDAEGSSSVSLNQLLKALISLDKLQIAMNMYKSRLSDSVRLIVRTCILEYLTSFDPTLVVDALESSGSNSDAADTNTPFAARVREMTNENFLSCLSMCYENVLIALRKAETVHQFIDSKLTDYQASIDSNEDTLSINQVEGNNDAIVKGNTKELSEQKSLVTAMIILSKSCLSTACELSQRSIVQLLSLRKESYGRMSVEKMKFLWEISIHFVSSIEKIMNGSSAYIMRQSLLTQTKYFVDTIHEGYKGKLINFLDNEKWVQCDVSTERQSEIDRLVSGKSFLTPKQMPSSSSANSITSAGSANALDSISTAKKEARPAKIEESSYNVVWSVLFLVEVIMTYLDISLSFPLITSELISKIIELIRLLDHRTRQLVLGAQSIQSAARLKSISARHLAITARSIDFLSSLLPHIRTSLLAQLSSKHHILLQEFDRISSELLDHHSLIVSKFVSIVSDFIDSSSTKLRQVDWDRFQGQCEYFDEVLKNVSALHRVLLLLLPPEQLQDIFHRIFSLLNRKIPMHFDEIMPSTQTGKQRILDDVSHLVTTFSRLKQIDCKQTTLQLDEIFRRKYGSKDQNQTLQTSEIPTTETI